jgi:hypothetical protein
MVGSRERSAPYPLGDKAVATIDLHAVIRFKK